MTKGAPVNALDLYLYVECSEKGVKRIGFSRELPDEPSVLAEKLAAHLEKGAPCPAPELDLSGCTDFQKRIYATVQGIERGRTMTYGEVAFLASRPGAARAVGRAMAANPFLVLVPCHRVVARSGLGGFAFGLDIKERMLALERSHRSE